VADRTAQLLKARYEGRLSIGLTGAWLKEKQDFHTYNVNVNALLPDGDMRGVRIFEADARGFMVSITQAKRARFSDDGSWTLLEAERSEFSTQGPQAKVERTRHATLRWPTQVSPEMVSVALLKPDRMSTIDLFQYIQHLDANGQSRSATRSSSGARCSIRSAAW
jgi:lipopolysaccharide export system permease protein